MGNQSRPIAVIAHPRVAEGADEAEEATHGSLAPLAREVRGGHGSGQLGAGEQDQAIGDAGDDP